MTARPLPAIQRRRPIDASGLFWSLVFVLLGCFHVGMKSFVFAAAFFAIAIPGVLLQFRVWKFDSRVNREATEWCRRQYPELGGTPIVDLLVAMAQNLSVDFATLTPSTLLVDLVLSPDGRNDTAYIELSQMLQCVVHEARIKKVDCSGFAGSTLDDAIQFVISSCNSKIVRQIDESQ
jgi:hypothetical protein